MREKEDRDHVHCYPSSKHVIPSGFHRMNQNDYFCLLKDRRLSFLQGPGAQGGKAGYVLPGVAETALPWLQFSRRVRSSAVVVSSLAASRVWDILIWIRWDSVMVAPS